MGYINNSQEITNHDIGNIIPDHNLIRTNQKTVNLEEIRLQRQIDLFKKMQQEKPDGREDVVDEEEEDYVAKFQGNRIIIEEKQEDMEE